MDTWEIKEAVKRAEYLAEKNAGTDFYWWQMQLAEWLRELLKYRAAVQPAEPAHGSPAMCLDKTGAWVYRREGD